MKQDIAYYREQIMHRAETPSAGNATVRKNPYKLLTDRISAPLPLVKIWDALHTRIYRMRDFH
ncbi:MAG: hypothetical protein JST90_01190 [Bacteroidetes bacterium]|nr:hypothetical protein [Bacteroidota bacterium]